MALSTMPAATTTPPPAKPDPWQDAPDEPVTEPKKDDEPKAKPDPWQD
jgi:hypothetical protein